MIHRIRKYHALLAILATLAYFTGDEDQLHAWLGYGVACVLMFRIFWSFQGNAQLGLMRFYPSFKGLNFTNTLTHPAMSKTFMLGIMVSLLCVSVTGLLMDNGRTIGLADRGVIETAQADDDYDDDDYDDDGDYREYGKYEEYEGKGREDDDGPYGEALEEAHEFFANLLVAFVIFHILYLILFKRPLARFMLFLPRRTGG